MRGARDQPGPVADRCASELDRGRDVGRAVVDARQEVEVQLDALHPLKVEHLCRRSTPLRLVPTPGRGQVFLGIGDEPLSMAAPEQLEHVYRLADPALADLALEPLLDELLTRAKDILARRHRRDPAARRGRPGARRARRQGHRGGGRAGRADPARRRASPAASPPSAQADLIADVDHADILNPILREKGIRSLLGVPLLVEGASIGVLHVGTLTPRDFTDEDAALLQLAADRAALAIERARLFDALEREHRGAETLQRSLLPDAPARRSPASTPRRATCPAPATRSAATGTTSSRCPTARSASRSATSSATACGPPR